MGCKSAVRKGAKMKPGMPKKSKQMGSGTKKGGKKK